MAGPYCLASSPCTTTIRHHSRASQSPRSEVTRHRPSLVDDTRSMPSAGPGTHPPLIYRHRIRPLQHPPPRSLSRSDGGDFILSSSGDGTGRGGGDEGGRAGGDGEDWENAPMELLLRPLLKQKLDEIIPRPMRSLVASALESFGVVANNKAVMLVESLMNNPFIRCLLGLVSSSSETAVLCGSAVVVQVQQDDNLQGPSSCESSRSTMGDYGSHEIKRSRSAPAQNRHAPSANDLTPILSSVVRSENYLGTIVELGRTDTITENLITSTTNDAALNEKEGLLGFIYTLVWTILFFYSALVTLSVTYPGSQKALVSFNDTWTTSICIANIVSWFGGLALLPFASRFKDSKSTDHSGFHTFIWAIYLWLLLLIPEYFTTLQVFLLTPNWIVWPFGVAIFCLTVLPSIIYIESQQPMILKSKWAEYMSGKIGLISDTASASSGKTIRCANSDSSQEHCTIELV